jgi:hypothetical protein
MRQPEETESRDLRFAQLDCEIEAINQTSKHKHQWRIHAWKEDGRLRIRCVDCGKTATVGASRLGVGRPPKRWREFCPAMRMPAHREFRNQPLRKSA